MMADNEETNVGSEPLCRSTLPPSRVVHLVGEHVEVHDPRVDRCVPAVRPACQAKTTYFIHPDVEEWDGDIEDITCRRCRVRAERDHERFLRATGELA